MQPSAMRRARSVSFPIPVRIDSAEAPLVKHPGVWARKANLVIQHRIFYSIIDGPLFLKSELQSSWMGFQGNLSKCARRSPGLRVAMNVESETLARGNRRFRAAHNLVSDPFASV